MDRELITQAEYARRRGVTPPTVNAAVKSGRISLIEGKIDPKLADIEWDKNTDHSKRPVSLINRRERQAEEAVILDSAEQGNRPAADYINWKARRERAEALRAERAHEEESGNLYRKTDTDRAAKAMARLLRDQFMAIPPRVSAELAALDDPPAIERRLSAEIRKVLETIDRDEVEHHA